MKERNIGKNIFYCEDLERSWFKEELVGRKGLSLLRLRDMDVPVPDFFVISPRVFREVSSRGLERVAEKLLQGGRNPEASEVEDAIMRAEFPVDAEDELLSAYIRISGFTDAWVSVRSSIVFPQNEVISFSGVFSTELNVRGFPELKNAIKKVYASFFTDNAVMYASKHGIELHDATLAVVVQKMVQPEVSGTAFTIDPITQDKSRLSVEAVFGLGDVIASGEITPDLYILNKRDLSIVEQTVSPQEWMKVRLLGPWYKKEGNIEKVKISKSWSYRPKLNERELKEISKIALIIEDKERNPQNIEWVLSAGKVWVLQNKPLYEVNVEPSIRILSGSVEEETLREVVESFVSKVKDIEELEVKAVDRAKKMIVKEQPRISSSQMINELLIATGIGGSFGSISGTVVIPEEKRDLDITKRDILLIKNFTKDLESTIIRAGGVIMETGGVTSDVAILCREFKIPAVFGVPQIFEKVKNGDLIRIDGNTGAIYKASQGEVAQSVIESVDTHPVIRAYEEGKVKREVIKEEERVESDKKMVVIPRDPTLPPTATKLYVSAIDTLEKMAEYVGNSDGIVCLDLDNLLLEEKRHILAYVEDKNFVEFADKITDKICEFVDLVHGDLVILSIGSGRVKDFKNITKGEAFENDQIDLNVYGLVHYLSNPDLLKYVLKIVKRVRNIRKKRNVSLGIHSPMNADMVVEFKKYASSIGLKRSSTFEIYAILDNSSEVILADDILGANIDGVIVNTPWIAKQMQGYSAHYQKIKYNLGTNSLFKVVDTVIDDARKENKKCVVIAENSKELIKHAVKSGAYGIVVNGEDIKEARKLVSQEEARLIMSL